MSIFSFSFQTDIQLGESHCPGIQNIALGKYAEQSGACDHNGASKAVDLCVAGSDQSNDNCAQIDSTNDGKYPGKYTEGRHSF